MKNLFYLIVLLLAGACTPNYQLATYSADLTKYSDAGFIMTTATSGDHAPVAMLQAVCVSGASKINPVREKGDPIYGDKIAGNFRICTVDDLIDELYYQSIDRGANGMYELKVFNTPEGMQATGIAVKR